MWTRCDAARGALEHRGECDRVVTCDRELDDEIDETIARQKTGALHAFMCDD
jgi:hypothetical protein